MNLFINAVSKQGVLIIFDNKRNIVFREDIEVFGNESEKLINILNIFLETNKVSYDDLENIVVVAGPGSFTGIRTIILMINTINFVINKNITSIGFFDLFNTYPIVKTSSRRDCFLQKSKNQDIEIISNLDLVDFLKAENIKDIYGDLNIDALETIKIFDKIDYSSIIKNINFATSKIIEPLYIKKPSIG